MKMGNRRFNSNMPLQELEFFYSQQKREQDKQNSVRFFKDILCIGCNGIEMLSKWTKIGRLDGWSNSGRPKNFFKKKRFKIHYGKE